MKRVIALFGAVLLFGFLAACGASDGQAAKDAASVSSLKAVNSSIQAENSKLKSAQSQASASSEDSEKASAADATKVYALNEDALLKDVSGKTLDSIRITAATKTFDEHGQFLLDEDMEGLAISNEKTVQLTVSYTNTADPEKFLPSMYDFVVYDPNGVAADIVMQQEGAN